MEHLLKWVEVYCKTFQIYLNPQIRGTLQIQKLPVPYYRRQGSYSHVMELKYFFHSQ